jgi:hypothetical protein
MTPERVKRLIECYGGSPQAWPEDEREAGRAALEDSSSLQLLADEEAWLDEALTTGRQAEANQQPTIDLSALRQRIMQGLPPQTPAGQHPVRSPSQSTGQQRHRTRHFWHIRHFWAVGTGAALAAALVLMLIIEKPQTQVPRENLAAQMSFEQWAWEETTGEDPVAGVDLNNPVQLGLLEMGFAPEEL